MDGFEGENGGPRRAHAGNGGTQPAETLEGTESSSHWNDRSGVEGNEGAGAGGAGAGEMGTVVAGAAAGDRGDEGATGRSGVDGRVSDSAMQDAGAAPPSVEAAGEALAARLLGSRATLNHSLTLLERSALTLQRCDLVLQRSALLHFLARGSAERTIPPPPRPPEKDRGGAGEGVESEPAERA